MRHRLGALARLEGPERPAYVEHRRHAAGEATRQRHGQTRSHPVDLRGIRPYRSEIDDVRPRVEAARLEQVDVRVDEARDDPFSGHVDYPGPFGNDDLTASPYRPDALPGDEHDGVAERLAPGAVDNGRAHQGGHAGLGIVRRTGRDLHEQQHRFYQGSHGRPQAGGIGTIE
jgi:hypothetical protein